MSTAPPYSTVNVTAETEEAQRQHAAHTYTGFGRKRGEKREKKKKKRERDRDTARWDDVQLSIEDKGLGGVLLSKHYHRAIVSSVYRVLLSHSPSSLSIYDATCYKASVL